MINYFQDTGGWSVDVHLSTGSYFNCARWMTNRGNTTSDRNNWFIGDFDNNGRYDTIHFLDGYARKFRTNSNNTVSIEDYTLPLGDIVVTGIKFFLNNNEVKDRDSAGRIILKAYTKYEIRCYVKNIGYSTIPVTTNYVNIRWQEGNNLYYANSGFKGLNINQTKTIPIESDFAKITLQHNNYGFESIVGAHADSFGIIPEACEYNNSLTVRFYVVQF